MGVSLHAVHGCQHRCLRLQPPPTGRAVNPERLYLVCVETLLAVSFATLAVCHWLDRKAQR